MTVTARRAYFLNNIKQFSTIIVDKNVVQIYEIFLISYTFSFLTHSQLQNNTNTIGILGWIESSVAANSAMELLPDTIRNVYKHLYVHTCVQVGKVRSCAHHDVEQYFPKFVARHKDGHTYLYMLLVRLHDNTGRNVLWIIYKQYWPLWNQLNCWEVSH